MTCEECCVRARVVVGVAGHVRGVVVGVAEQETAVVVSAGVK